MMLLSEARRKFFEAIKDDGAKCPCCDRSAKVYSLKLNNAKIRSLIWLYKAGCQTEDRWVDVPKHAPKELTRTNQLSSLKHWDLVEKMPNDDPKKKSSGVWRVTKKGRQFALNLIKIPNKVWIYNDECLDQEGELVWIGDVDENFDYKETMMDRYRDSQDAKDA